MIVLKIFFSLLLFPFDTGSLPLLQPAPVPSCHLLLLAPSFLAALPQLRRHRAIQGHHREAQRASGSLQFSQFSQLSQLSQLSQHRIELWAGLLQQQLKSLSLTTFFQHLRFLGFVYGNTQKKNTPHRFTVTSGFPLFCPIGKLSNIERSSAHPGIQTLLQLLHPRRCWNLHRAQHELAVEALQGHAHSRHGAALVREAGALVFFKNPGFPCSKPT